MQSDVFKYDRELPAILSGTGEGCLSRAFNHEITPFAYRHFPQGKTQKSRYQAHTKKRQFEWFFEAKAKKIVSRIRFWIKDHVLDINFLQKFTRTDLFV